MVMSLTLNAIDKLQQKTPTSKKKGDPGKPQNWWLNPINRWIKLCSHTIIWQHIDWKPNSNAY